jgi:hypothetical protein
MVNKSDDHKNRSVQIPIKRKRDFKNGSQAQPLQEQGCPNINQEKQNVSTIMVHWARLFFGLFNDVLSYAKAISPLMA